MSARDAAVAVARRLRDAGHVAYFAGGCVRDELLGHHPDDYDVATDAAPDRVVELFDRTHTIGAAFAVVLVRLGGQKIEVATFRTDGSYSDARRPDSVELSTPEEDADRRDFTINALFLDPFAPGADADPACGVVDYVGGVDDLRAGVIRAVGVPDDRLNEDHLRALRAVRFAARFGFRLDEATARAIRDHAADLRGVSRERIGDEVRRMLRAPSRAEAIGMIESLGLGESVLGSAPEPGLDTSLDAGPAPVGTHGLGVVVPPPPVGPELVPGTAPVPDPEADADPVVLALGAWAAARSPAGVRRPHGDRAIASAYRRALKLSNTEQAGLRALLARLAAFLDPGWATLPVPAQKRLASAPGAAGALGVLDAMDPEQSTIIRSRIAELAGDAIGLAPERLLSGDDLVDAGFRPGPEFGALLDAVYDDQLSGRARDRGALLDASTEHAARLGVERT